MAFDTRNPDYAALRALSQVWLRAVALAWDDESFARALNENAERALEEYFNYKCPFSINLSVLPVDPKKHGWIPGKDGQLGRWNLPPNQIIYNVPSKPDTEMYDEAVALAAYVQGGPTYLFSCC
jgi:ribosomally synthesized peptide (two-chain TOMM family)